ncbi:MAG: hypothetical protein KUL75_04310 [Sterolibacterium sp.]|nr:hypothetical protein [Sterolibacterium sp.]
MLLPWPALLLANSALALPAATVSVPPLVDVGTLPEPASAQPRVPPALLLYNPLREAELLIFTGAAQRFIESARPLRPKFNAMSSREKVNFLERYVFAMCNSRLVNGMDMVFKLETGSENFCGYMPGMLSCFAADSCNAAAYDDAVKYIRASLAKFDRFIKWSDRRKWQYRGDAFKVAFYTRNTLTKRGQLCATLKLLNDNEEAVVVRVAGRLRLADGSRQSVFTRPYYVAPRASLPNLSDEDLFSKDTEMRMRKLTADAQVWARQMGVTDIQAYTGTHERWNCVQASSDALPQTEISQVWVEFVR